MAKQPIDNRRRSRLPSLDAAAPDVAPAPGPAPLRAKPANENDPGTAMMLQRLRRPPSYDVIWAAAILSAIWAAGWFWVYKDVFAAQSSTPAGLLQSFALLVLPVLFMLVIAFFLWRTQQLRQVSEVLMHQAMRLIRPQDIATDGLTSIAQAVRQEVDLLVGGVEHAFQRATALEEIVHKEIAAVERAFGSNEDRIRSLVNGLETQRAALQQTSSLVASDAQPMLLRLETNTQNLGNVVNVALSTFGRLEDGLKNSTAELAQTIEAVSQRAAETGQEIGSHSAQFERMSTMLVGDFRGFSSQLQEHIQTLNFTANNLGGETRKFGTEVKGMESNLLQLLKQSSEQLVGAHTEVTQAVERAATQASNSSKQTANDLLQTFGQIGDTISYQLKTSSSDAAALIERTGLDTAGRIEQAHGLISNGLQNVAADYVQRMNIARSELTTHVDQSSSKMMSDFESSALRFNERFLQTGGQLVTSLDQSSNNLVAQLGASSSGLMGSIKASADQYATSLTEASNLLSATADAVAANVNHTSTTVSQEMLAAISQATTHMNGTAETMASNVNRTSSAMAEEMMKALAESSTRLHSTAETVKTSVNRTSAAMAEEMLTALSETTSRLNGTAESVTANVSSTSSAMAQEMLAALSETSSRLNGTADALTANISRTSNLVSQNLESVGGNVNDLLVATSGTIAAHLKETSEIVSRQMQDSGLALAQNIENSGGNVTDRLISVSGEFMHKFATTRDGLLTAFLGASGDLTSNLQDTSTSIYSRMQRTTDDVVAQLESVHSQITERLDGTVGVSSDRIAQVTEGLTSKLDVTSTQLGSLLAATERRLGNQLEQASTELDALFNENTRMLTAQLEQSSNTVTSSFAETAVFAAQKLDASGADVTAKIDHSSQMMFNRLHGTTQELGKRFDVATDHLELVTTEISKRLDGQGQRFVEILDQASGQIFSDLGKARDAFSEGLGETTLQISGRFEQETGLLVGRIDKAVEQFDSATSTSSSKLYEAADKFAKHVSTTNVYLVDQLASAAGDIDTRLESVSMQLTGKLEMTGSRISERLDDVSTLVDKSVDKFNLEMEHMLQSRRDALENLVSEANRRAADVDKTMNGYIAIIEDSLSAAEQRSHNIGRLVSDQSSAALARLEEELRKLETNSTGQVAQAARALREQHERALANMNEMLSSTASDFQQTAQDMRITAQQVVKDIDAARGELKRAVIDLPEETRSNADNMRRVVADQISALNALADVVRKQTGSLDYSGPGYMTQRPAPAASRYEPAHEAPPQRSAPQALARVEAPPVVSAKISGLAKEVESYNSKLNVSARDVVEAIEGQLPRDMEKRYAASDKSVYTQRLYETRSRKLVKALENRYAEERLLRSRVQAFNRLFEKLLDTVSETDGGEAVMEQVLASEQGRIYVMLAEVAGRLPSQS